MGRREIVVGMADVPSDLSALCADLETQPAGWINLILPEIGGGQQPDSAFRELGDAGVRVLTISGLDQRGLERVVREVGPSLVGLHLWKCPRIVDFSPLEAMPLLEQFAVYWNQRVERLWNLTKTPALRGLRLEDFTRLHDLSSLAEARSLRQLEFGDKIWDTSTFATLEPVGELSGLRHLRFTAKRIEDDRIEPIARLQALESLWFTPRLFAARQLAWLRARLPDSLHSESIAPFRRLREDGSSILDGKDVIVNGRRGPILDSTKTKVRLERQVAAFERCVAEYRALPQEKAGTGPL